MSSNVISNCIDGAIAGFTIAGLAEAGVVIATASTPPGAVLVGGLIGGAILGCILFNYFNKPAQPVYTNSASILFNEDTAQFDDIVRQLADMYDAVAQTTNNFNVDLSPAIKYDLLWILALNYNDYYSYISSVQSYKQYLIQKTIQSLSSYNQNIIFSAQAYAQTLAQIQEFSISVNSGNPVSAQISNITPIVIYQQGQFGDLNYVPIAVGFGVQYVINGNTYTLVALFDNPSNQYVACNANNPNSCTPISFNYAVLDYENAGLMTILPYTYYYYATQSITNINYATVTINSNSTAQLGIPMTTDLQDLYTKPVGNNIAVLVNPNSSIGLQFSSIKNFSGTYLNFEGIVNYLEYLNNLNLEAYAVDLWNYYHNMGYTQQQLLQMLEGTTFNIYFPQCNPSVVYGVSQIVFNLLNELYAQGESAQLNVFPIFAYGTFSAGGQVISGYAQFNQAVVLQPGQSTNVGGFIIDTNGNIHYIAPGSIVTNVGQNTVVFRPDVYIVDNQPCSFVPVPYSIAQVSNPPQNTVGIVLNLNSTQTFYQNQNYNIQGWYTNQYLDASNTEVETISFTPSTTFTYIPYNQAYITIQNTLPQYSQNVQASQSKSNIWLYIILGIIAFAILVAIFKKSGGTQIYFTETSST